jgi:hypothetical protein
MAGFDIQGAKAAGYSDAEIADYLAQQSKFDAAGARGAGYSDQEIIGHLSPPTTPPLDSAYDPREARVTDNSDQMPLTAAADAGINKALVDLPGIPGGLWNASHQVIKKILTDNGHGDPELAAKIVDGLYGPETKYTPQYFEQQASAAGVPIQVPDPSSAAQRYTAAAAGGAIGGVPGIIANVANQGAADLNLPPEAQAGVGLLSSFAPAGLKRGTQWAMGINNPEVAAENIRRVEAVGAQPTLGMAAGPGSNAQALESLASGVPGGGGITRAINEANAAAGQTMEDIATNLSGGGVTDTSAGLSLQQGLGGKAPGGTNYLEKIRGRVNDAYAQRDAAIPAGTQVDISGFLDRVKQLSKEDPAFEQYIKTDPVFSRIKQNLDDASNGVGTQFYQAPGGKYAVLKDGEWVISNAPPTGPTTKIPYQDAAIAQKALGQLVDSGYMFGSTTSQFNGSLAQAAKAMGRDVAGTLDTIPAAKALDARATKIWQEGELAKENLKPILSAATGTGAMDALLTGSAKGGEVIDNAMRGLSVDQQNLVAGAVVQKLGRAVPSAQGAEGGAWSANTFLTNWNKLHDDAKVALFRNMPPAYRQQLTDFAQYAENIKESRAVYSNPSGTANRNVAIGVAGTAALGAGSALKLAPFHPAIAAGTLVGALAPIILASGTAKMVTNPGIVRWLAASTKLPMSSLPVVASQLAKLGPDGATLAQQLQQQAQQQ